MPYLRDFAGNSTTKENSGKRISTKLGVPMPYLWDFVDNSIMKENQGKRIAIKLGGSHALFEGLCRQLYYERKLGQEKFNKTRGFTCPICGTLRITLL